MGFTLRKLRVGLVVGAAVLVSVVAGFVWYGQHAARLWFKRLPKQLGVDIKQEANGFTYSQSVKGKTVFTVHASKEVQRQNGMITLHDAGIVLYGRQDGKADRIHGSQFEFDQPHGVMTAVGEVYIDLAAPAGRGGTVAGDSKDDESKLIHVKTSGLTFDQKTRVATTNEGIEFAASGLKGTAVGADYDSASGMVVLRSAVHVSGLRDGRPVDVVAGHAVLDRTANTAVLMDARYMTASGKANGESVAAHHVVIRLGKDSQPERLEVDGHVVLAGMGRGEMTGDRLDVGLNGAGQAKDVHLWGGVGYREAEVGRTAKGSAQDVRVNFDGAGRPTRALVTGMVSMEETVGAGARSLRAEKVDLGLTEVVKGRVVVREAEATGGASVRTSDLKAKTSTDLSGDDLKARFVSVGAKERVTGLTGLGHTVVNQVGGNGVEETSSGETLEVSFKGGAKAEIERAVQRGGVKIVRTSRGEMKGGKADVLAGRVSGVPVARVQHASADEAVFDGETDKLTLAGGVRVVDAENVVMADRVAMERGSGDSSAEGNVRVSYVAAAGKGEPVHVTSARAVERHGAGTAEFFGVAGKDARMWQGGSQVEAPVIRLEEAKDAPNRRRLTAHGDVAGDAAFVRAVLVGDTAADKGKGQSGPVKVTGHEMVYVEGARTVTMHGRVRVEDRGGVMTAREATVFLAGPDAASGGTSSPSKAGGSGGFPAGKVERMVADGGVQVEQAGRRAMGDRLVYTAADQTFVMTGTGSVLPKIVDDEKGTITGATLHFKSGDKSVMILGGDQRVHGETRVRQ